MAVKTPTMKAAPGTTPVLVPMGHHAGKPPISIAKSVILVGSRSNAHLHLLSRSVSKAHALILTHEGNVYIRDLASRERLFVNGREIREAWLKDGDLLKIGSFTFKYKDGPGKRKIDDRPNHEADLEVEGAGAPLSVSEKVMLVGRRPTCDVSLIEGSVSTAHAVIFLLGGKRFIRDLGSRTGTFVNGKPIHQQELSPGDRVRIGETEMHYVLAGQHGHAIAPAGTEMIAISEPGVPVAPDEFDLMATESQTPSRPETAAGPVAPEPVRAEAMSPELEAELKSIFEPEAAKPERQTPAPRPRRDEDAPIPLDLVEEAPPVPSPQPEDAEIDPTMAKAFALPPARASAPRPAQAAQDLVEIDHLHDISDIPPAQQTRALGLHVESEAAEAQPPHGAAEEEPIDLVPVEMTPAEEAGETPDRPEQPAPQLSSQQPVEESTPGGEGMLLGHDIGLAPERPAEAPAPAEEPEVLMPLDLDLAPVEEAQPPSADSFIAEAPIDVIPLGDEPAPAPPDFEAPAVEEAALDLDAAPAEALEVAPPPVEPAASQPAPPPAIELPLAPPAAFEPPIVPAPFLQHHGAGSHSVSNEIPLASTNAVSVTPAVPDAQIAFSLDSLLYAPAEQRIEPVKAPPASEPAGAPEAIAQDEAAVIEPPVAESTAPESAAAEPEPAAIEDATPENIPTEPAPVAEEPSPVAEQAVPMVEEPAAEIEPADTIHEITTRAEEHDAAPEPELEAEAFDEAWEGGRPVPGNETPAPAAHEAIQPAPGEEFPPDAEGTIEHEASTASTEAPVQPAGAVIQPADEPVQPADALIQPADGPIEPADAEAGDEAIANLPLDEPSAVQASPFSAFGPVDAIAGSEPIAAPETVSPDSENFENTQLPILPVDESGESFEPVESLDALVPESLGDSTIAEGVASNLEALLPAPQPAAAQPEEQGEPIDDETINELPVDEILPPGPAAHSTEPIESAGIDAPAPQAPHAPADAAVARAEAEPFQPFAENYEPVEIPSEPVRPIEGAARPAEPIAEASRPARLIAPAPQQTGDEQSPANQPPARVFPLRADGPSTLDELDKLLEGLMPAASAQNLSPDEITDEPPAAEFVQGETAFDEITGEEAPIAPIESAATFEPAVIEPAFAPTLAPAAPVAEPIEELPEPIEEAPAAQSRHEFAPPAAPTPAGPQATAPMPAQSHEAALPPRPATPIPGGASVPASSDQGADDELEEVQLAEDGADLLPEITGEIPSEPDEVLGWSEGRLPPPASHGAGDTNVLDLDADTLPVLEFDAADLGPIRSGRDPDALLALDQVNPEELDEVIVIDPTEPTIESAMDLGVVADDRAAAAPEAADLSDTAFAREVAAFSGEAGGDIVEDLPIIEEAVDPEEELAEALTQAAEEQQSVESIEEGQPATAQAANPAAAIPEAVLPPQPAPIELIIESPAPHAVVPLVEEAPELSAPPEPQPADPAEAPRQADAGTADLTAGGQQPETVDAIADLWAAEDAAQSVAPMLQPPEEWAQPAETGDAECAASGEAESADVVDEQSADAAAAPEAGRPLVMQPILPPGFAPAAGADAAEHADEAPVQGAAGETPEQSSTGDAPAEAPQAGPAGMAPLPLIGEPPEIEIPAFIGGMPLFLPDLPPHSQFGTRQVKLASQKESSLADDVMAAAGGLRDVEDMDDSAPAAAPAPSQPEDVYTEEAPADEWLLDHLAEESELPLGIAPIPGEAALPEPALEGESPAEPVAPTEVAGGSSEVSAETEAAASAESVAEGDLSAVTDESAAAQFQPVAPADDTTLTPGEPGAEAAAEPNSGEAAIDSEGPIESEAPVQSEAPAQGSPAALETPAGALEAGSAVPALSPEMAQAIAPSEADALVLDSTFDESLILEPTAGPLEELPGSDVGGAPAGSAVSDGSASAGDASAEPLEELEELPEAEAPGEPLEELLESATETEAEAPAEPLSEQAPELLQPESAEPGELPQAWQVEAPAEQSPESASPAEEVLEPEASAEPTEEHSADPIAEEFAEPTEEESAEAFAASAAGDESVQPAQADVSDPFPGSTPAPAPGAPIFGVADSTKDKPFATAAPLQSVDVFSQGAPPADSGFDPAVGLGLGEPAPQPGATAPGRRPRPRRAIVPPRMGVLDQGMASVEAAQDMPAADIPAPAVAPQRSSYPVIGGRRNVGKRIAILAVIMLILTAAAVAVVWYLVKPRMRVEGTLRFNNTTSLTRRQQEDFKSEQQNRLFSRQVLTDALGYLAARSIDPGFLKVVEQLGRIQTSWSADNRAESMRISFIGSEANDAKRVYALMEAMYQAQAQDTDRVKALAANIDKIEKRLKAVEETRAKLKELQAQINAAPSEEDLRKLDSAAREAEIQYDIATAAVKDAARDLKLAEEQVPAAANPGAAPAELPPDPRLMELQRDLEAIGARLAAARGVASEQADAARKALDKAIESFQQAAADMAKGNPELARYVQAVQQLQERTHKLSGDLIEIQQQQYKSLSTIKKDLDDQIQVRKNELWAADKPLAELLQQQDLARREYEAARDPQSGTPELVPGALNKIKDIQMRIDARKAELGSDPIIAKVGEGLQELIKITKERLDADRRRIEQDIKDQEANFARSGAVEQLPEAQRKSAAALKAQQDQINELRKQYAQALEQKNAEANAIIKELEKQSADKTQQIDDHKRQVAAARPHLNKEQEEQRRRSLEQKQAALKLAQEQAATARKAYLERNKALASALSRREDTGPQRQMAEALDAQLKTDLAQAEQDQRTLELLKEQRAAIATIAQPSENDVSISPPQDDRILYGVAAFAAMALLFGLLVVFTALGSDRPRGLPAPAMPEAEAGPMAFSQIGGEPREQQVF